MRRVRRGRWTRPDSAARLGVARAPLHARNGPQVLVDRFHQPIGSVPIRGPRHDDEDAWRGDAFEVGPLPQHFLELIEGQPGREPWLSGVRFLLNTGPNWAPPPRYSPMLGVWQPTQSLTLLT